MRILIDADACPVTDLVISIAKNFNIKVLIFCDSAHNIKRENTETIVVPQDNDAVDFILLREVKESEIVVTQDYGLASLVLSKKAYALNQNGLIYNKFNIETLLLTRHLSKKMRDNGKRTLGPKKRTEEDNINFKNSLINIIGKGTTKR
ncbi:MAG: YaiI/YqxD family protein [Fusobacteriaceae bacterium]